MAFNPPSLHPPPRPSYYSDRSSITDSVSNFITEQLADRNWTKEQHCCICETQRGMGPRRARLYGCKFCAHAVCAACSPTRLYHLKTEKEERVCSSCFESQEREETVGEIVEKNKDIERLMEEKERLMMVIEEWRGTLARAELGQVKPHESHSAKHVLCQYTQFDLITSEKGVSVRCETEEKGVLKREATASAGTQVAAPERKDQEIDCTQAHFDTGSGTAVITTIDSCEQVEVSRNEVEMQCEYRGNPFTACQTESCGIGEMCSQTEYEEMCVQTERETYEQTGVLTLPIEYCESEVQTSAHETNIASLQTDPCLAHDKEAQICPSSLPQPSQIHFYLPSLEATSQTEFSGRESHTQTPILRYADMQTDGLPCASPVAISVQTIEGRLGEEVKDVMDEAALSNRKEERKIRVGKCRLETGTMQECIAAKSVKSTEMLAAEPLFVACITAKAPLKPLLLCCPQTPHHILPSLASMPAPLLAISHSPALTIPPVPTPCLHISQFPALHIPATSPPSLDISDPTIKRKAATTSPFALAQSGECSPTTALLEADESHHCPKVTQLVGTALSREVQTEVASKDVDAACQQMEEIIVRNENLEKQVMSYRRTLENPQEQLAFSPKDLAEDLTPEMQERLSVRFSENDTIQALLFRLKSTEKELGRLRSPINGSSTKSRPSIQPGPTSNSCKCSVF